MVATDQARADLFALDQHTRGILRQELAALAADPYGGLSIARTADSEDDRITLVAGIGITYSVTYSVSPNVEPPIVTITGVKPPKNPA
ncbi:hypothetical protein ACWC0C_29570 [Streptomyces sp. NPDC001709]